MKKAALLTTTLQVGSVLMASLGCRAKEEEEKGPAKEKPTAMPKKAETKVVLTCGMEGHPQFEPGKEPADGRCPQCGMKLVEKEVAPERAE